jgi:ribosomal protein S18 acetylase RimI-like enzyme
MASRRLVSPAAHAAAQSVRRVFLQVEDDETAAQGLYRKAGFATAWR